MKRKFSILACRTCFILLLSILFLVPSSSGSPVYEDFTSFIEVDEGNDFTQTTTRNTVSSLRRDRDSYVYKSYGSGHFGDSDHLLDVNITASVTYSLLGVWALTNTPASFQDLPSNALTLMFYQYDSTPYRRFTLRERGGSEDFSSDMGELSLNTIYYLKITRDRIAQTLICKIYSDSERTNLLDTLNIAVIHTDTFEYIQCAFSRDSNGYGSASVSGYCENLNLQEGFYITFYNNTGGILRVDNATITNGTQKIYSNGTVLELSALTENRTYHFLNFTWTNGNSTTNPYNYTVTSDTTIWCYFDKPASFSSGIFIGAIITFIIGLIIGICFGKKT